MITFQGFQQCLDLSGIVADTKTIAAGGKCIAFTAVVDNKRTLIYYCNSKLWTAFDNGLFTSGATLSDVIGVRT